ncbi:hypothetical protein [Aliikangiella sp. IMCC44359]|uniref:hypothetical protein n=1 Tax=Aliikangiella sp. IMCC44359 TaxID=3459125 RepID=UPI00403B2DC4
MSQKIFFKQQEVENTLLCAREVMDMTACFLCSLVKYPSNHDQQNLIYSLALSYAQMEQMINDNLKKNFGINESDLKQSTTQTIIAAELKEKLKLLTETIDERREE